MPILICNLEISFLLPYRTNLCKKKNTIRTVIEKSITAIPKVDWATVVADRNIYLSIEYLTALEVTTEREIDFLYAILYDSEDHPVMVSVFQLVTFLYRKNNHPSKFLKHFSKDKDGNLSMNMLVCGNVFSHGENGFLWSDEIHSSEAFEQMARLMERIKEDEETRMKISVLLFKEFWPNSIESSKLLSEYQFKDFMIDVNMVLPIHESWSSLETYMSCLKTKFRNKVKGVYKKSSVLSLKSLNFEEIEKHQTEINELFMQVVARSHYSFGAINSKAFGSFKKALGENFLFRAVFYKDKLVGFSSAFFHKGIMEANYVGMDYALNVDLAIYQRLLYDYVEQGIDRDVKEIQFGRTSELLKSSLGAEPVDMTLYARHKATIPNMFLSSILCFVSPSEFELRKPFKSKFMEEWTR